jgi:Rrf2 family iron-sulfur cluster assembly transcriptional regulator
MRVTKWGECGILCALYLARRYDESTVGASDIAENQGLDLQYTQQILHRLRKGNVIESVRGPKGGYRLVQPPEKTTLKEILYAAEGDTFQIICDYAPIHPNADAPNQCATKETCSLHGVWQDLRTAIDALLEQKTLADLLTQPQEGDSLVQLGKKEFTPTTSKV